MLDRGQHVPGSNRAGTAGCRVAVIWIDWYAYHVARFCGLNSVPALTGRVTGLELVGGVGVHAGLKFREDLPPDLAIETLMPDSNWANASKLRLSSQLWQRLSQLDPEVVLVPGYYTLPAIAAAFWARLHGRISVLMTESTATDHKRVWWKEWAKGLLLRVLFDWAVTGGKEHVSYLKELGFATERTAGCYDVVDNAMFRDGCAALRSSARAEPGLRARLGLPSQYFLYVGRIAEEKNVGGLFSSWLEYRVQGGAWPLVLVGDGPLAPAIRETVSASALAGDVHFPGLKASRALLPYYAFAGCFVLPSTREPWGLVVNEAMASGLPVLVSDRCGCAADLVVEGQNGFVFEPTDGAALTRKMHQVEALSAEDLGAMGRASENLVRSFSPHNFGLEITRIADFSQDSRTEGIPQESH